MATTSSPNSYITLSFLQAYDAKLKTYLNGDASNDGDILTIAKNYVGAIPTDIKDAENNPIVFADALAYVRYLIQKFDDDILAKIDILNGVVSDSDRGDEGQSAREIAEDAIAKWAEGVSSAANNNVIDTFNEMIAWFNQVSDDPETSTGAKLIADVAANKAAIGNEYVPPEYNTPGDEASGIKTPEVPASGLLGDVADIKETLDTLTAGGGTLGELKQEINDLKDTVGHEAIEEEYNTPGDPSSGVSKPAQPATGLVAEIGEKRVPESAPGQGDGKEATGIYKEIVDVSDELAALKAYVGTIPAKKTDKDGNQVNVTSTNIVDYINEICDQKVENYDNDLDFALDTEIDDLFNW